MCWRAQIVLWVRSRKCIEKANFQTDSTIHTVIVNVNAPRARERGAFVCLMNWRVEDIVVRMYTQKIK